MNPFLVGLMLFLVGAVLLGIPWGPETKEALTENVSALSNPTHVSSNPTPTNLTNAGPDIQLPSLVPKLPTWDLDLITSQERPSRVSHDMAKLLTSPFVLDLSTLSKDYIREEITELPEDSYDMEDKLRYKGVLFDTKNLPMELVKEDDETQRVRGVVRQVMNDPNWEPVITKTGVHIYEVNEVLPVEETK